MPAVKFGGAGITAWGCFWWNGLGHFVILYGNINPKGYKDILTCCVLSMVEGQFGDDDCIRLTMLPAINQGLQGNGLWTTTFQTWTGQPRVLT
jgi:hypothetical protein